MIRVVPLELSHLEDLGRDGSCLSADDPAWTMLKDDHPVAAGGIQRIIGGAIAWTEISAEARKSPLLMRRIHKAAHVLFRAAVQQMDLMKVNCFALADDESACRWPEDFGFTRHETYRRFQWVRD